jgi:hypothetical protein
MPGTVNAHPSAFIPAASRISKSARYAIASPEFPGEYDDGAITA